MGGSTLIFGVVAALVILLVGLTLFESGSSSDDVSRPAAAPSATTVVKPQIATDTGGSPSATPMSRIEPVAFLDAPRRGTADFTNSDFKAARTKFEQALKGSPDNPELVNNLGLALERMGQIDAAIVRFEQAAKFDPKSWAYHFNLAHAVSTRQDWNRAIAEYRTARDILPADYATQYNLAMTLHRKGDEMAAIPEFERAVELAPAEATVHLSLATSLEKAGRLADAKREYQQYVDMAPRAENADNVRNHLSDLK